jgi:hypothetical protein
MCNFNGTGPVSVQRYLFRKALVVIFCIMTALPSFGMLVYRNADTKTTENRKKTELTDVLTVNDSWWKVPKRFDDWFSDNFAFRDYMVKLNNSVKFYGLGVSPTEQVILGKDGWLYYNSKTDGDPIGCYRGTLLLRQSEVQAISLALEEWRLWLRKRGIRFVVMFPPNTPSVYPEYLPRYVTRVSSKNMFD